MPRIQVPENLVSKLTKDQQIAVLNSEVRCTLKSSGVHGIGVFAIRNIYHGERCYCRPESVLPRFYNVPFGSLNKLFPEVRQLVLDRWASVINGSIFKHPNDDATLICFMNHSENPNYDIVSDTALRDIKTGEELLEDYTVMDNWEQVYSWIKKETKKTNWLSPIVAAITQITVLIKRKTRLNRKKISYEL